MVLVVRIIEKMRGCENYCDRDIEKKRIFYFKLKFFVRG